MRNLFLIFAFVLVGSVCYANTELTVLSQQSLTSPETKVMCEEKWPKAKKSSKNQTYQCIQYWLLTYEYNSKATQTAFLKYLKTPSSKWREVNELHEVDYDTNQTGNWGISRFSHLDFQNMEKHVKKHFQAEIDGTQTTTSSLNYWLLKRGEEFFSGAKEKYISEFGGLNDICPDLRCLLVPILKGEEVKHDSLKTTSDFSIWKARNAIFARHGRDFKNPSLKKFFYEKRSAGSHLVDILPVKTNPGFDMNLLTKEDHKNLKWLKKFESKK